MSVVAQYTTDGIHEPKCFALPPGTYYVQETDPPGYASSGPNWFGVDLLSLHSFTVAFADQLVTSTATSTPTSTSTLTPMPSSTPTFTLTPTLTPTPTTEVPAGSVWGTAWEDLNQDGRQQPEEPPIAGAKVVLAPSAQVTGAGIAGRAAHETLTNAAGLYQFLDVEPGFYELTMPEMAGFWPTTGLIVTVHANSYTSVRADFGYYHPPFSQYLPVLLKS